jgi:hypothetical protein
LATFDIETDPFKFGRTPEAFCLSVYDGEKTDTFWGADCVARFVAWLDTREPLLLYAHNGGKFDFFYLLSWLRNPLRIIHGRIVEASIGRHRLHRLRDSFAILPVPLRASGAKLPIEIAKLEHDARELHRDEIIAYNVQDCRALFGLVRDFRARFGNKLTIGAAAIAELAKHHPVERLGESHDTKFRPFYFGGRVENFKGGILAGAWQCFDVNSMYPHVMAAFNHPLGRAYEFHTNLARALRSEAPFFAAVDATSRGAFVARPTQATETLSFPHATRRYMVTGHELATALDLGLVRVHHVAGIWQATRWQRFDNFVAAWYAEKEKASADKTSPAYLHAKLILNSAYGKFGSNPANYYDYKIFVEGETHPGIAWNPYADFGRFSVLRAPATFRVGSYFDVAVAASITGAARSVLLRGLATSRSPVYCDTDSVIAEGLEAPSRVGTALGQWKLEATGDVIALAGKKLYCLQNKGVTTKIAAKGVNLTSEEIFALARGFDVTSIRAAPVFSLAHPRGDTFVQRTLKGKP